MSPRQKLASGGAKKCFNVTMTKIVNYEVSVQAETASEAMEIASQIDETVLDDCHVVGGEITTDFAEVCE